MLLHHLDRIEIDRGNGVRILADRDLAGIVFDQVARQFGGELRDARQRQQRMAGQLVADRERLQRKVAPQRVVVGRDHRRDCGERVHEDFS